MESSNSRVAFRKGHGTGNDFVLIPDPQDRIALGPRVVAALCDRQFGLGADGVIRVVPAAAADVPAPGADWFMDYWNADGTIAEMCGNGARVFARHLVECGLQPDAEFLIGTRGGVRVAQVRSDGCVSVSMGRAESVDVLLEVDLRGQRWPASGARVPNPHAVAFVGDLAALGDLSAAAVVPGTAFPRGVNIEFVTVQSPHRVTMRVLERGSGETLSCGTGACAAAWTHRRRHDIGPGDISVKVTGGEVVVSESEDGELTLTGPAVFVADGVIDSGWWQANS